MNAVLDNDIPAIDWLGQPIDAATCAGCEHAGLRASGGCKPGRSCPRDVYARRIDRFFRSHPALANGHLGHPYFEVRAIAARHADLFHLGAMLDDADETVRLQVALRVPQRLLLKLRADPHREVRIRVALRIDLAEAGPLLADPDYQVRCILAKRLPEARLAALMHDPDLQVRLEVARRLPMPALWTLAGDPAAEVRRVVAERLPSALLGDLAADSDWTVRWEAAGRASGDTLARLRGDIEPEVRERAAQRAAELADESLNPPATRPSPNLEPSHG